MMNILYGLLLIVLFVSLWGAFNWGRVHAERKIRDSVFIPWLDDIKEHMNEAQIESYDRALMRFHGHMVPSTTLIKLIK